MQGFGLIFKPTTCRVTAPSPPPAL